MQEMSVLCIMAALFCTGMGLKKRQPAEPELPKIADPVVNPAAERAHGGRAAGSRRGDRDCRGSRTGAARSRFDSGGGRTSSGEQ